MPELPEVETVVRTLEHLIQGRQIQEIHIIYPNIVVDELDDFIQQLKGQHFKKFKRRGKYLIFEMDDVLLVTHLRMEGKFYVKKWDEPLDRHTHLSFLLDENQRLDYNDTRKFGRMELMSLDTQLEHFKKLGPEPFSDAFNEAYIQQACKGKNIALKTMLMDQSFVAGIGNIYADEVCFAMKLHPLFKVSRLTKAQRSKLIEEIRRILSKAIEAGGSTIRSYTSSLGVNGLFQLQIEVYGKQGQPCICCGTKIQKIKVNQRGSCFCPKCQRKR